ncbi:acetyltransferase [Bordetella avium]|uniref:Glycosyl transferase n=1 Tax=Bordetella avium (strain 197N) TaxID=360910 RepID=Q2KUG9_BORA1|nr:acetyltransferase [Bordetella avium]AZY50419.1 glycosyl transferase [Bordetella avium]AZY53815.1 glycosyl transferase [Bordetella avium]RIQ15412.1 acetyltransferase [Bordetella avium]RIQ19781.1 acetyltransferase [Bordetella avium]RIQ34362.1 acetyltransferase [Bordetella avium]
MTIRLCLLGAGGYGREVLDCLLNDSRFEVAGFVDDSPAFRGNEVAGVPVLGGVDDVPLLPDVLFLASVGSPALRRKMTQSLLARGANFARVLCGYIGSRSQIGASLIHPGAVLSVDCQVADYVSISFGAVLGHDTVVGDYTHIGWGAFIAGNCHIGEGVLIEPSVCIARGLHIGSGAHIGLGSVVLRDVPEGATVLGNPGRVVR